MTMDGRDNGHDLDELLRDMDGNAVVHEAGVFAAVKMELEGNSSLEIEPNDIKSDVASYLHQETMPKFGEQQGNAIESVPDLTLNEREIENGHNRTPETTCVNEKQLERCMESDLDPVEREDRIEYKNAPGLTLVEREIEDGYNRISDIIPVKEEELEHCVELDSDLLKLEDEGDFDPMQDSERVEFDPLYVFVASGNRMGCAEETVTGSISNKDIITSLLEVPFLQRCDFERNEIVKRGRPTPNLPLQKRYRNVRRYFRSSWYEKYKWLCGSGANLKLFCWSCLLSGSKKTLWSTEGYDDLKNLSGALFSHAIAQNHLNAQGSLKASLAVPEVLTELQKIKYNEYVGKNTEILKLLIDVTSLLCKQDLAFAGHNGSEESFNRGNFNAIFQLVLSRNSDLKRHWENMGLNGLPKYIPNKLIECLQDEVKQFIESRIKQAPFFAFMVDETTDILQKTRCAIRVRFVDCYGEIQEHFLGFYDVNGNRTAGGLFRVLFKALENGNIKHKLIAQTYDGSCVTAGELNCLQAEVREHAPQALLTHCFANCLSLVLQQSCSTIKSAKIFFSTLEGIRAFFHSSSRSSAAVVFRVFGKRIPTNGEAPWNFDSYIINAVHQSRLRFIEVFKEFASSSDSVTVREAQGFLDDLESFTFVFLLSVFQHIFQRTDLLFNTLRKKSNDTVSCVSSVFECVMYMRNLRDDKKYDEFIRSAESATGSSCLVLQRHELGNKYVVSSNYYKQIYLEILDDIIIQLEVRFSSYEKLKFFKLVDTNNYSDYHVRFPHDALISLVETYGVHFNKRRLRAELETVFSPMHEDTFHSLNLSTLIKKMIDDGTNEIIPEAYKLFTLIATIPASCSAVETSFSCLNRMKTYFWNCIDQDSLSALALVSIEKEVLSKLECRATWHDDLIECFTEDSRVNLLCK